MTCEVKSQLDAILEKLDRFEDAFPLDSEGNPDISGHRRGHEAAIAADNARKKFYDELRLDLAKKGLWAIVLVLVGLIFAGALAKLGLGPSLQR